MAHDRIQERLAFSSAGPEARESQDVQDAAEELLRELSLRRPLVFLDLESTGLDPAAARIVEISIVRVECDRSVRQFDTLVCPGVPIPPGATRVHGIRDEDVRDAPTFAELSPKLQHLLQDADLAGYNLLRFDLPLLAAEFARAGVRFRWNDRAVLDACVLFHRMERRDLAAAYRLYCGVDLDHAHRASGDVLATVRVLAGQLRRYDALPRDVARLSDWLRGGRGDRRRPD